MDAVIRLSSDDLGNRIVTAIDTLTATGWTNWAADCCLHCSDFPSDGARKALEALDTAAWLLHGLSYRDYLAAAPR